MIDPGVERQIINSREGKKGTTIKSFLILYFFYFVKIHWDQTALKAGLLCFMMKKSTSALVRYK